jgi:hypothetical protein
MGYLQLDSKQKAAWRLPNLDADARAHPPRGLRVRSPPVALPLLLSSCSTVLVDCLKICPPPRPIGSGKKALMHGPLDPGKSCSCSWPARGQGGGHTLFQCKLLYVRLCTEKKPDQNRIDRASVIRQIDTRASNLTDTPGRAPDDRRGLLFVPLALLPARATLALIGGVVWCGKLQHLWHAMPSAPYLVHANSNSSLII